jgi:hypothetical protein
MSRLIGVKVLGEYEITGVDELDGEGWMTSQLFRAKMLGQISDYSVIADLEDASGTHLVLFLIDKEYDEYLSPDQSHQEAMETTTRLINEIVNDTSATVRWLAPLEA